MSALSPGGTLRGVFWMLVAMSCIGVVDGMAKYLSASMHGVQVVWGYTGASLACFILFTLARRDSLLTLARSRRPWLQTARGVALLCSLSTLFVALHYLPLAVCTTISFTAPLIIVVLSGPVLGERVGLGRWLAVLVGLVGAVVVVRPGSDVFHWASLLPLLGAFFFAGFHIATRTLGAVDRPMTTVLYTFVTCAGLTTLALPTVWSPIAPAHWSLFAAMGALGFGGHLAMARSLVLADSSTVAPLNYVRLLWAIGIGYVVFEHVPDAATLLGGALIVASGLYVVRGVRVRG